MSKHPRSPPIENSILAALPDEEYNRLAPDLESVLLPFMGILHEPGDPIKYVYFPNKGLISLLVVMEDGTPREVGLTGKEGMLGISVVLGMNTDSIRALIQMEGSAMRVKALALRDMLTKSTALNKGLQRYIHSLFTQVSQSAACLSSHEVDKRLSRWLVMTHDRAVGDVFEMKHEFMAMLLGVTRSVVTRAAGNLQKAKMIRYTRGQVTILDRARLEATACECYRVLKEGKNNRGAKGL